jgi:hypothetical protein
METVSGCRLIASYGKCDGTMTKFTKVGVAAAGAVGPRRDNYNFPVPHRPARFSANEASPSEASNVWRLAECIFTRRA